MQRAQAGLKLGNTGVGGFAKGVDRADPLFVIGHALVQPGQFQIDGIERIGHPFDLGLAAPGTGDQALHRAGGLLQPCEVLAHRRKALAIRREGVAKAFLAGFELAQTLFGTLPYVVPELANLAVEFANFGRLNGGVLAHALVRIGQAVLEIGDTPGVALHDMPGLSQALLKLPGPDAGARSGQQRKPEHSAEQPARTGALAAAPGRGAAALSARARQRRAARRWLTPGAD